MSTVKIIKSDNNLSVSSPYLPEFPSMAKRLGGKWDSASKTWNFDLRDEQHVRELCIRIYGTDGETVGMDLISVQVTLKTDWCEWRSSLFLFGRQVATAFGRDSGAKLGEGIIVLSGRFISGGSVKNWKTIGTEGTVFEIRDLPKDAIKNYDENAFNIKILGNDNIDRGALLAEKERLQARIAEIDAILNRA